MDKLKAILAFIRYIPDIMRAIEPLFGPGMGAQKKALVSNIVQLAVTGGDVLGVVIDASATAMNEQKTWAVDKPGA